MEFYGIDGSLHLQRPVVGIVATADHDGHSGSTASHGGVFSDRGHIVLRLHPGAGPPPQPGPGRPTASKAPIVGMVPTLDHHGYFMVASMAGSSHSEYATFAGSCYSARGCSCLVVAAHALILLAVATGPVTSQGAVDAFVHAPAPAVPGNTGRPITGAVRTPTAMAIGSSTPKAPCTGTAMRPTRVARAWARTISSDNGTASAIFTDSFGDGYGVSDKYCDVETFGGVPNDGGMGNTNLNGSIIAASGF